ncbi:hypothetical protein E2C01_038842 [Portunus trituberculatus]|uniref:Uncharacterized protein n=1 Tax=Portunus trituberculatus TaxID=210409 RepID=A0A5B7FI16_PORTR|nr:hypothetical protein [Portunus trituberculatus]
MIKETIRVWHRRRGFLGVPTASPKCEYSTEKCSEGKDVISCEEDEAIHTITPRDKRMHRFVPTFNSAGRNGIRVTGAPSDKHKRHLQKWK